MKMSGLLLNFVVHFTTMPKGANTIDTKRIFRVKNDVYLSNHDINVISSTNQWQIDLCILCGGQGLKKSIDYTFGYLSDH